MGTVTPYANQYKKNKPSTPFELKIVTFFVFIQLCAEGCRSSLGGHIIIPEEKGTGGLNLEIMMLTSFQIV
jgi:hypothetical protein